MTGSELARAAATLAGAPFRLHGRDPAYGLDCIGVLAHALTMTGGIPRFPRDYTLRQRIPPPLDSIAANHGFVTANGVCLPGDVVIARPGPCQFHLAIALTADRFVHAHAGLGRVVIGPLPWPIVTHWRLPPSA